MLRRLCLQWLRYGETATVPLRLLMLARLIKNGLTLTQELVFNMLGVRREGGTETAGPR